MRKQFLSITIKVFAIVALLVLGLAFFSYYNLTPDETIRISSAVVWRLDYVVSDGQQETPPSFFGFYQYPLIQFASENQIIGIDGCNEISAIYTAKDDKIAFCAFETTLEGCHSFMTVKLIGGGTRELEVHHSEFLSTLARVYRYEIDPHDAELRLFIPDVFKDRVMVFHPSFSPPWDPRRAHTADGGGPYRDIYKCEMNSSSD